MSLGGAGLLISVLALAVSAASVGVTLWLNRLDRARLRVTAHWRFDPDDTSSHVTSDGYRMHRATAVDIVVVNTGRRAVAILEVGVVFPDETLSEVWGQPGIEFPVTIPAGGGTVIPLVSPTKLFEVMDRRDAAEKAFVFVRDGDGVSHHVLFRDISGQYERGQATH